MRKRQVWIIALFGFLALGFLAYVAHRRFYLGVARLARAVEEVADSVEGAAEGIRRQRVADEDEIRETEGETRD